MQSYISMLRGINVSGVKRITMDELKKLYESLGFSKVQTYIQSGNVVFESKDKNAANLTTAIENKIKKSFGFDVRVITRTKEEFVKVIAGSPFAKEEPNNLYVTFLSDAPTQLPVAEINKVKSPKEDFHFSKKEIYLYCPNGYGNTKLSNNFFERKLKIIATTRNWKTVNKLLELTES